MAAGAEALARWMLQLRVRDGREFVSPASARSSSASHVTATPSYPQFRFVKCYHSLTIAKPARRKCHRSSLRDRAYKDQRPSLLRRSEPSFLQLEKGGALAS